MSGSGEQFIEGPDGVRKLTPEEIAKAEAEAGYRPPLPFDDFDDEAKNPLPFDEEETLNKPTPSVDKTDDEKTTFLAEIESKRQEFIQKINQYKQVLDAVPDPSAIADQESQLKQQYENLIQLENQFPAIEQLESSVSIYVSRLRLNQNYINDTAVFDAVEALQTDFAQLLADLKKQIIDKRNKYFEVLIYNAYKNDANYSRLGQRLVDYTSQTDPSYSEADLDKIQSDVNLLANYLLSKFVNPPYQAWQIDLINKRYAQPLLDLVNKARQKLKEVQSNTPTTNLDNEKSVEKLKAKFEALFIELTNKQSFTYTPEANELKQYYNQFKVLLSEFKDLGMSVSELQKYRERMISLLEDKIIFFLHDRREEYIKRGNDWSDDLEKQVLFLLGDIVGESAGIGILTLEEKLKSKVSRKDIIAFFASLNDGLVRTEADITRIESYFTFKKLFTSDKFAHITWLEFRQRVGGVGESPTREYPNANADNYPLMYTLSEFINGVHIHKDHFINMVLGPREVVGKDGLGFDPKTKQFYTVPVAIRNTYTRVDESSLPKIEFTETARSWLMRWFSEWALGRKSKELPQHGSHNFHINPEPIFAAALEALHTAHPATKDKIKIQEVMLTFRWWALVGFHQSVYSSRSAEGSDYIYYFKEALLYFMYYYSEELADWNPRLLLMMFGSHFQDLDDRTADVVAGQLPADQTPAGMLASFKNIIDNPARVKRAKNALKSKNNAYYIDGKPARDREYYAQLLSKQKGGGKLTPEEQIWIDSYIEFGYADYDFLFDPISKGEVVGDNIQMTFKSPLASIPVPDLAKDPTGKTPLRYKYIVDGQVVEGYPVYLENVRSQSRYIEVGSGTDENGKPTVIVQYIPDELIWELLFVTPGVDYGASLVSNIANLSGNVMELFKFFKEDDYYSKLNASKLNWLRNKVRYCLRNMPGDAAVGEHGLAQDKDPAGQFYKSKDAYLQKFIVKIVYGAILDKAANDKDKAKKPLSWSEVREYLTELASDGVLSTRDALAIYHALDGAYGLSTAIEHWSYEVLEASKKSMQYNKP